MICWFLFEGSSPFYKGFLVNQWVRVSWVNLEPRKPHIEFYLHIGHHISNSSKIIATPKKGIGHLESIEHNSFLIIGTQAHWYAPGYCLCTKVIFSKIPCLCICSISKLHYIVINSSFLVQWCIGTCSCLSHHPCCYGKYIEKAHYIVTQNLLEVLLVIIWMVCCGDCINTVLWLVLSKLVFWLQTHVHPLTCSWY